MLFRSVTLPYKSYVATISQAGTAAPLVQTNPDNSLGISPTFNYVSQGIYTIDITTFDFDGAKTIVFLNPGYMPTGFVKKLAHKKGKSVEEIEGNWKKAKKAIGVTGKGTDSEWAQVVATTKRMSGVKKEKIGRAHV